MLYLGIYLVIINILGYIVMGRDKKKARHKQYRISEKTLFTIALIGGSLGSIIGMYHFRHKTKHWYFVIGMPFICIAQASILFYIFSSKI